MDRSSTFIRWLQRGGRALRRAGPLGFLKLALQNVRILLSGKAGQHRYIHDDAWDRKYGVDTAGTVAIDELTAPQDAKGGAIRYEPTPPECFTDLLDQADIGDPSGYTFIDIGSGKGRVLLLAGLAGFRRALGVEFGEELHAIARRNIEVMKARASIGEAASICADARSYSFPPEPTVCFLNNPFGADLLAEVLDNIEASLREQPRPFSIIYYHSNHAEVLDRRPGWEVVRKGEWRDESHHFAIYRWKQL